MMTGSLKKKDLKKKKIKRFFFFFNFKKGGGGSLIRACSLIRSNTVTRFSRNHTFRKFEVLRGSPISLQPHNKLVVLAIFKPPIHRKRGLRSSSVSISSSGRRCPNVTAKLMPVFRHSACRCHRTKRICDVFLLSLSWLSSASFPGYHSLQYRLL